MSGHNAIVVHEYGKPEVMVVERVSTPEPAPGEVLIRVRAAGVNPIDWKLRSGMYKQYMPLTFPWTPGIDLSGVVEKVGPDVKGLKVGDEVFGVGVASYAEFALAKASDIQPKPKALGFEDAASVPVGALTAWQAVEVSKITKGTSVLVLGAAGGVGLYAVQLAVAKGADTSGSASAANLDFVKKLGATRAFDYALGYPEVKNFDAVIDTFGGPSLEAAYGLVKKGGVLVTVAGRIDEERAKNAGIQAVHGSRAPEVHLKEIAALLESRSLRPEVQKVFALADAPKAHAISESGHGRGRILLKP